VEGAANKRSPSGVPGRHNTWVIQIHSHAPDHPVAAAVLRAYMHEIVARYDDRPATEAEIDEVMREYPDDDLAPPSGLLLVATDDDGDTVLGCVGVRVLEPGITEITRMFVRPEARRRGIASQLIKAAEEAARGMGATLMRLDTRKDLVEARALYPKHGYTEIADYNGDFYADHWFEKSL
jgi:GNAT superfamily N-acetyltransferase